MQYEHKIDKAIMKALNDKKIIQKYALNDDKETKKKREELHFGGILKAVKELYGRAITRRILDLHLDALERQKIIDRDPLVRAPIPRFYRLTKNAKLSLELELPLKVQTKREENARHSGGSSSRKSNNMLRDTKEQRNKKVYLLLMSLVAIGFSVPEPLVSDYSKVQAGDFYIGNKPHKMSDTLPGISISDFFHEYRDSANGWRFRYVKFKDTSEVKWYFDKLSEYEPPLIKPIGELELIRIKRERERLLQKELSWPVEGETRYGIIDRQLHEFLLDCTCLLGETESLMEHVWKYKRRPKREEVEWYQFLYGKHRTSSFFTKINQKRIRLKNATKQSKKAKTDAEAAYKAAVETDNFTSEEYKAACEILDYIACDETINRIKTLPDNFYKTLKEKYNSIHENYKTITGPLMNEIAHPQFLSSVWDKIRR
jgi:DNA-binding HxlR family transcriptional regulator